MSKVFAYCGLACHECETYKATKADDDFKRAEVAKNWSKLFNADITPDQINCTGCSNDGVIFFYCGMCEIRKCSRERNLENCGMCDDYACEKLDSIFKMMPSAKTRLDEINQNR